MSISPERRLFQAVVAQSMQDACGVIDRSMSPKKPVKNLEKWRQGRAERIRDAERERDAARDWLTSDSFSFRRVCEFAGYDPEWVRDGARRLAADGWPVGRRALRVAA